MGTGKSIAIRINGLPLSGRMAEMGIVGMIEQAGIWCAEFRSYPGIWFTLPLPVADWLLGKGGDVDGQG